MTTENTESDDPGSRTSNHNDARRTRNEVCANAIRLTSCVEQHQPIDTTWIRDRLIAACDHLPRAVGEIAVTLVDDARMRSLHARHLHEDTTTDVMTFDLSDHPNEPIQADIVLGADVASRAAVLRGSSIERELLLYALHGLLHCCGFDDHDASGFRRMHAEEDRILSRIGVGSTFARSNAGGESA